jgi:beta-glucosidase
VAGRRAPPPAPTRPVDGQLVYAESIHVGNCAYDRAGVEPAFCFGHGLGYSSWDYLEVTAPPRLDPATTPR